MLCRMCSYSRRSSRRRSRWRRPFLCTFTSRNSRSFSNCLASESAVGKRRASCSAAGVALTLHEASFNLGPLLVNLCHDALKLCERLSFLLGKTVLPLQEICKARAKFRF